MSCFMTTLNVVLLFHFVDISADVTAAGLPAVDHGVDTQPETRSETKTQRLCSTLSMLQWLRVSDFIGCPSSRAFCSVFCGLKQETLMCSKYLCSVPKRCDRLCPCLYQRLSAKTNAIFA